MARFSGRITLSNELKQLPISELVQKAKSLIQTKRYSQRRTHDYSARFNDLLKTSRQFDTENLSVEFVEHYIEEGRQRNPKHTCSSVQRKSLLNLIASSIDCNPVFSYEKEAEGIRNESLRNNLDIYEEHLRNQDKSKNTIISYLKTATNFLLYLDKSDRNDFTKVTATDVREFISELGTKWSSRSMRIVSSQLKTYLSFVEAPVDAILFTSFRAPRKSKPVQAMNNENIEALWKYVKGEDEDLRSKAVIALMLATGMRPVDIAGLKLDDINWNNDTIGFIQSKTGEYMNIKLFPAVGSAIVRYITEQRPKGTGARFIFLSQNAPNREISPSMCNRILENALGKMGIAYAPDGLHCPRAIRRSLVSRMISKGIPIQKAAASIGHVDEESVDLYTELDVKIMRSVCLPIPNSMKGWLQAL